MAGKSIPKELMVGLIYPAVLGTIIYSLFDIFTLKKCDSYLSGDVFNIIIKSVLVLAVISFYCCDFLYASFTKEFKWKHFWFDFFILIGLYFTFDSMNLNNKDFVDLCLLTPCFMAFMVIYLFWDYPERGDDDEGKFYKKIVKWEIRWLLAFLIPFGICFLGIFCYEVNVVFATILIVLVTFSFTKLILQKKKFYDQNL